jgi:CMP-N-acetylneuraminic acid synthetase
MDDLVSKRIAVIPARGGSKRLPKKNIIDFMGKPMIAWTIEAALASQLFDLVLVSTDNVEIAAIAKEYGAVTPFLRNTHSDDHSTVSEATLTALKQLHSFNSKKYDTVVQLMANCPLRSALNITEQVTIFESQKERYSLLSGFSYGMFNPWWAHYKDKNGLYKKLLEGGSNSVRSQDLPELICPSGATWITGVDKLYKHKTFYSPNYSFHKISWIDALDIDDSADLQLAKTAFRLKNENL